MHDKCFIYLAYWRIMNGKGINMCSVISKSNVCTEWTSNIWINEKLKCDNVRNLEMKSMKGKIVSQNVSQGLFLYCCCCANALSSVEWTAISSWSILLTKKYTQKRETHEQAGAYMSSRFALVMRAAVS